MIYFYSGNSAEQVYYYYTLALCHKRGVIRNLNQEILYYIQTHPVLSVLLDKEVEAELISSKVHQLPDYCLTNDQLIIFVINPCITFCNTFVIYLNYFSEKIKIRSIIDNNNIIYMSDGTGIDNFIQLDCCGTPLPSII